MTGGGRITDAAVIKPRLVAQMNQRPSLTPGQCRAARGLLRMKQGDLCARAGVAIMSMSDFESGKTRPYQQTLESIQAALEAAGVEFLDPDNNGGPGVRLREAED